MKKFKLFAVLGALLTCGIVFAACDDEPSSPSPEIPLKNFYESQVTIPENQSVTFDGESHAVEVSYRDIDVAVTYSKSSGGNFVSADELNLVDAGKYQVYYRLNAKGFNTFTSTTPVELTILPKDITLTLFDSFYYMKSTRDIIMNYGVTGTVANHDPNLSFDYEIDNEANLEYNQTYEIIPIINNSNYNLNVINPDNAHKLKVVDYVQNGENYYPNIQTAIASAVDGNEIIFNANIIVDSEVTIDKSITLKSSNFYRLYTTSASNFASTAYAGGNLASIITITNNANVTLESFTIDGGNSARGITVLSGSLSLNDVTVGNCKDVDDYYSAGVYLANGTTMSVINATIQNNYVEETDYRQYGSDIWIDSGAIATIGNAIIQNIYVGGSLTINMDSSNSLLTNVYLDSNSKLDHKGGTIENLMDNSQAS